MTCKELGGACDREFNAKTFEEKASLVDSIQSFVERSEKTPPSSSDWEYLADL